jgi:exopolysaccharide biosynthesis polyprenyl glycosylphosphotransferase
LYLPALGLADGLAMAVAVAVAVRALPVRGPLTENLLVAGAVAAAAFVGLNATGGLYQCRRRPSLLDDAPTLIFRAAFVAAITAVLLPMTVLDGGMNGAPGEIPPGILPAEVLAPGAGTMGGLPQPTVHSILLTWLWITCLGCAFSGSGRLFGYAALRAHRRRRPVARAAIVVGASATAAHVTDVLRRRRDFGLEPVGQLLTGNLDDPPVPGLPVLGRTLDLPDTVRQVRADAGDVTIVVCAEEVRRPYLESLVRACRGLPAETLLVLSTAELLVANVTCAARARIEHLAGLPCVRLGPRQGERVARTGKRLFDLVAASLGLMLALPVLLACALAVRIEGGPGVLFRQRRVGRGGRQFVLLKFRSLRPADDHEADTRWSVDGDARIGPVGRFLRDTSLDELPQLWNVVRGDMSLVGPRPERPHFVRLFAETCPEYELRHRMPVGITGWAQVNGLRGDTSIELRAKYDNRYIDTWSFGTDLKILLMTVRAVLARSEP